jgi:hypothetical protein
MNPNRRVPGLPDEWMDFAESDMRLARLAASDTSIRREEGQARHQDGDLGEIAEIEVQEQDHFSAACYAGPRRSRTRAARRVSCGLRDHQIKDHEHTHEGRDAERRPGPRIAPVEGRQSGTVGVGLAREIAHADLQPHDRQPGGPGHTV